MGHPFRGSGQPAPFPCASSRGRYPGVAYTALAQTEGWTSHRAPTTAVLELPTWIQARPWGPTWAEVSPTVARGQSTSSSRWAG